MSTTTPISINKLNALLQNYLLEADINQVNRSWQIACDIYQGLDHFSGKSYLNHLLEVSSSLASMYLDVDTIVSGMMYEALQHGLSREELEKQFASSVATIICDCNQISAIQYNSTLTHQTEDICNRLLTAANNNLKAVLVMLTGRLHDIRSLDLVDQETRLEIALESRDLYAPLATQHGITWMKHEFEDFFFQVLHPNEYSNLSKHNKSTLEDRQQYVDKVIRSFEKILLAENYPNSLLRIIAEPQHLYTIYKQSITNDTPFERIYDTIVFVIIVEFAKDCYETLEIIHANWTPSPGTTEDFIAVPGHNGYQGIHTTVAGPENHFLKIKIYTREMNRAAKDGVAAYLAHGKFKVHMNCYERPINIRCTRLMSGYFN